MPTHAQNIETLQDLLDLLREHSHLRGFRELFESPQQMVDFAQRAKIKRYEQGEQIYRQGKAGHDFLIVIKGQIRAVDTQTEELKLLSYFSQGEIVGERAILANTVRTATVEVVTNHAILAFFDRDTWNWLTSQNPQFENYFQALEKNRLKQSEVKFRGKQWDETVVDSTKRHFIAYLSTLPLPLTLLIGPILFFLAAELLGIQFIATLSNGLVLLAIVPFVAVSVIVMIYNFFDWRNDDFIVTTKRVIHIERYLFFGEQRRYAPLTRIQDVTVTSGILDVIFEADNLRITTAGAGVIDFNNIRRANEIRQVIFRERDRSKARVAAADVAALRKNIAHQLNWEEKIQENVMAVAEDEAAVDDTTHAKTIHYNRFIDYFIPRAKEVDDAGGGTIVIWRKHFLVLLIHIFLPILAIIISSYLFLASMILWLPPFGPIVAWPIQVLLGVAVLVSIFWYIWQYDDWSKDQYIVTDTQIIDIEASSFRLTKTRREGTFDNIQGVYSEVPSLFYKLLNMGNVIIETAGTQETFTFNMVFDPASVTREIFNRWAQYQQREREKSRDSTTNQILDVLKEYHHLAKKKPSS